MEVMAFIEFKAAQAVKPVEGSIPMEELGDTRPAGVKEMENLEGNQRIHKRILCYNKAGRNWP